MGGIKTVKRYKLTSDEWTTYKNTKWGPNITHEVSGTGDLCSNGWIHVYSDPRLAIFLDPVHGSFGKDSILWEVNVSGKSKMDMGLKEGWESVTTLKIIEKPILTTEHRIRAAIYASALVYSDESFLYWAKNWLNGNDRSERTAEAETAAARAELWAGKYETAAEIAIYAAKTAVYATVKAAYKAAAETAADAEYAAAAAIDAADAVTYAAAYKAAHKAAAAAAAAAAHKAAAAYKAAAAAAEYAAIDAAKTAVYAATAARVSHKAADAKKQIDLVQMINWAMSDSIELPH